VERTALRQVERSFDRAKRDVELADYGDEREIRMLAAVRLARDIIEANLSPSYG